MPEPVARKMGAGLLNNFGGKSLQFKRVQQGLNFNLFDFVMDCDLYTVSNYKIILSYALSFRQEKVNYAKF